jgi:biotin carboxyl carrier protein
MRVRRTVPAVAAALAATALAAWLARDTWRGWLDQLQPQAHPGPGGAPAQGHGHSRPAEGRVRLSPQARDNLRLVVKPVRPQTYWRTVQVPGVVAERRGKSDRGVAAPVAGVVGRVHAVPGDAVRPGAELVTLRLNSELLHSGQAELNKVAQELTIVRARLGRVEPGFRQGVVPEAKFIELQNQVERLEAARKARRNELALRGLTAAQIDAVERGQFLTEVTLRVPDRTPGGAEASEAAGGDPGPLYEVEELRVQPGEQVQPGHVLCYLANHQALYVEGRAFREDTPLVERAAARGWPVTAAFSGDDGDGWPPPAAGLTIQYLANTLDPASQTFPFYVPLDNQHRDYQRDGKTYRIWRFRPGQRVRLGVRAEEYRDVFVVPADAVVREGPEAYVFRQNGEYFERRPVHVFHEDQAGAVLANDGGVTPGSWLAQNGAAALNRALNAGASGEADGEGHGHEHHHHHHD